MLFSTEGGRSVKMSVRAFESQTLQFKELQETVNVLKLKAANDGEAHPRKQAKLPTRTMQRLRKMNHLRLQMLLVPIQKRTTFQ